MLRYTGHPIVDIGAATIAALVGKRDLSQITERDLDKAADFLARNYVVDPLKSYLSVAFPNSGYTNPAYEKTPEKRAEYARRVLYAYKAEPVSTKETCVFTGEPTTAIAFSESLPAGRAFRQHVPMLTGEGYINFHPGGAAGLPVSGIALLCIQAFPLGCAKCGGKLLAVHSDSPDLTYEFAARFLADNRQALLLAQQARSTKMPEARMSAKTLLIETLLDVEMRRREEHDEHRPASVTAYHLTNSGQSNAVDARNPPLEIYHLPLELTMFLSLIQSPVYRDAWRRLSDRAWQLALPKKSKKGGGGAADNERPKRNFLYEDLFQLPDNSAYFVRHHFLRIPVRTTLPDDPRRSYRLQDEAGLVSWQLTALFLREVMNMEESRIKEVRELGDRLASYVAEENDRRFFTAFYAENRSYDNLRNALIRANMASVKSGRPPLITLDPYIQVFEQGDEVVRADWRLARDLVLIRMIEQLYQLGWLGANKDAIPEAVNQDMGQSSTT